MSPDRRPSEGSRNRNRDVTEAADQPPAAHSETDASSAGPSRPQSRSHSHSYSYSHSLSARSPVPPRKPVSQPLSLRTSPNSAAFASGLSSSAGRGGSPYTTPSPFLNPPLPPPAPCLDLPPSGLPLQIATTELQIEGTRRTIALQNWSVTKTPHDLLFKWMGTNVPEVLEHYIPYGVFPSTLHRKLNPAAIVSFLQPHKVIFREVDGSQHFLNCSVRYEFQGSAASIEFQSDVREMTLVNTFDFKCLWSERFSKSNEGESMLQCVKIWQSRQLPFNHHLSFFSTRDRCDREFSLLRFEANAHREPQSKVVYLDFEFPESSEPELSASPSRKFSFSSSIAKSFHREKPTHSKRGSLSSTHPINDDVSKSLKYLAIEFATTTDASDFVNAFQSSYRADHAAQGTSFNGALSQTPQTVMAGSIGNSGPVGRVLFDKSVHASPRTLAISPSDDLDLVAQAPDESLTLSPTEISPASAKRPLGNRSPPAERAARKDILISRPSFLESESRNTILPQMQESLSDGPRTFYTYDSLESDNEIRLLVVQPSDTKDDKIRCHIIKSINQERPPRPYEALSYTWGSKTDSQDIYVLVPLHPPNRKHLFPTWTRLRIRANLYSAIQHLRKKADEVVLWIDAICIDQDNIPEKNTQVAMMSDIYRRASNVMIWLGEGSPQSDKLLTFIKEIGDAPNLDRFLGDESNIPQWKAFAELMTNRWFSRRWVVQEVALAKRPRLTIHCGHAAIFWKSFAVAVERFTEKFDSVDALVRKSQPVGRTSERIGHVETGAHVLVKVVHNFFPWNSDSEVQAEDGELGKSGGEVELHSTLETLISELTAFESTDPRDAVFAILSLASDTAGKDISSSGHQDVSPPVPDYDKPVFDVLKEFVAFAISSSEKLDIICRAWAPPPKKGRANTLEIGYQPELHARDVLPSWMPSVKKSAYGTPTERLVGRQNGDSFVGTPKRKFYNASANTVAVHRFGKDPMEHSGENSAVDGLGIFNMENPFDQADPRSKGKAAAQDRAGDSLFVAGFRLDIVEKLSQRVSKGVIPREYFEIFDYHLPDPDDDPVIPPVPEVMWRTMVADHGPDGRPTKPSYEESCNRCLAFSVNGDVAIDDLIKEDKDERMVDFLKRVRDVVWNRKFLRTNGQRFYGPGERLRRKKLYGLASYAKENDLVCILLGCSVPVILREHWEPSHYFELIGEAYIHGMMNGEATSGKRQDRLLPECEEFELR